MRRITAVAALAGIAAASLLGMATPALADGWGSTTCDQVPSPVCDLVAGSGPAGGTAGGNRPGAGGPAVGIGGSPDPFACRTVPVDYQPPGQPPEGPGGWFMVLCSADGKNHQGPIWIPAEGSATPILSPAQVAEMARKRLQLPTPRISANPAGDQLVNLPTWMWLSSGWEPVSATASVPGVSVTATAKPTSVSWSMGDGSTVTCTGAGTPFRAGSDPRAPSPDCGHTYRTSSAKQAGQAFPVTATVHWAVTWSGAGQGGTFPNLTTTGNAAFRVAESQALNNKGGG
ncbi:ATP/GTP-binding protein [Kibdelosporangium persicum]